MDNGATTLMSFMAYETSFRGGVRVAGADFGGDDGQNPNGTFRPGGAAGSHSGDAEILTAPGPGRPVDLELFDFNAQLADADHIGEIPAAQVFGTDFTLGGFVTGGFFTNNVDSDGFVYADVAVGADVGGAPQLKMYRLDSVANPSPGANNVFVYLPANQVVQGDPAVVDPNYPLTSTFPFDINLRGGLRIGTIRNLSAFPARDTLVVGPGPGGGPEARLLNAQTGADAIPPIFTGDLNDRRGIFVG
jgi:hypothetical protein